MMSTLADAAVFLSSATALSILVKATLVLGLGLGAAWLAGRQRASLRHLLLAATFAALMALPSVLLFGPEVSIAMPAARQIDVRDSQQTTVVRTDRAPVTRARATAPTRTVAAFPSVAAIAVGLWGLGAILIVGSLLSDLWRVRRVVRQGLPWIDRQPRVEAIAAREWRAQTRRRAAARGRARAVHLRAVAADDHVAGGCAPSGATPIWIGRWSTSSSTSVAATGRFSSRPASRAPATGAIHWCGRRGAGSASKRSARATTRWCSGRSGPTTPSSW